MRENPKSKLCLGNECRLLFLDLFYMYICLGVVVFVFVFVLVLVRDTPRSDQLSQKSVRGIQGHSSTGYKIESPILRTCSSCLIERFVWLQNNFMLYTVTIHVDIRFVSFMVTSDWLFKLRPKYLTSFFLGFFSIRISPCWVSSRNGHRRPPCCVSISSRLARF